MCHRQGCRNTILGWCTIIYPLQLLEYQAAGDIVGCVANSPIQVTSGVHDACVLRTMSTAASVSYRSLTWSKLHNHTRTSPSATINDFILNEVSGYACYVFVLHTISRRIYQEAKKQPPPLKLNLHYFIIKQDQATSYVFGCCIH